MKYRKYTTKILTGAMLVLALGLTACATTGDRSPDSESSEEGYNKTHRLDGREPSSLRGDFGWINAVEDDFGRIASETSSRAVASKGKHEVLLKSKGWVFSYLPKTNHFYVDLQGNTYKMVQTTIDNGERFAFAAEGQSENPLTFSVVKNGGRGTASGQACETEISYWHKTNKTYVTDHFKMVGKPCERLMSLLKDYVP